MVAVLGWDFRGGARVWLDGWLSVGRMDGWDGERKGKRQCECGGWMELGEGLENGGARVG